MPPALTSVEEEKLGTVSGTAEKPNNTGRNILALQKKLAHQVGLLCGHLQIYRSQFLRSKTLNSRHMQTLDILSRDGTQCVGDLQDAVKVLPAEMTRLSNKLKRLGYVRKKRDTDDGRVINVSLTDEGQDLIQQRDAFLEVKLMEVLKRMEAEGGVDPAHLEIVLGAVRSMVEVLNA